MTMPEVKLENCWYAEQLSMALLHVSHPPVQTCGGEDILYFLNYFLDPITNPCLGAHLAALCYTKTSFTRRRGKAEYIDADNDRFSKMAGTSRIFLLNDFIF